MQKINSKVQFLYRLSNWKTFKRIQNFKNPWITLILFDKSESFNCENANLKKYDFRKILFGESELELKKLIFEKLLKFRK